MSTISTHQPGYFRNLYDSTATGACDGYNRAYEHRTLDLYDKMKDQPRFQNEQGVPITVGEWTQAYPGYRHSATMLGVLGGILGGATGLGLGLIGRHYEGEAA
ncbi:MAG: hypothetical protein HY319_15420 [Armatimonadetes bacterium]|nr:hypothetical protein [Armatimonadota bacterium]